MNENNFLINIIKLEHYISLEEKKKLLILVLSLFCFVLISIFSFSIILFLNINLLYFLICIELYYLGIIILALTFSFFYNIPLGNIYALFILIIAALESVLGLSLIIINKYIFNNISFSTYKNNRY
jgi:NADH:ubiquinone oxidoreductase subunit K